MALLEHVPPVRLDGQVALVTAGRPGVGRAIALALSDAGAAVAVCARSEDQVAGVAAEISDRLGRALAIRCDVTRRQEVEGMIAAIVAAMGAVDQLVNNAGSSAPSARLRPPIPTTSGGSLLRTRSHGRNRQRLHQRRFHSDPDAAGLGRA
jgi:NAD(P)-dependent dehydrogenase (short-subunit alcohol dehydrogenase family)